MVKAKLIVLLYFLTCILPLTAAEIPDSTDQLSSEEVRLGERIFYGLVEEKGIRNGCVSCHNTVEIDTLNWNPSAYEIAIKYKDRDISDFSKAVLSPSTPTMSAMHKQFKLTDEDVVLIKAFLDHVAVTGLTPRKPVVNRLMLFILLGLVITLVLIDLIFTHKVKYRAIHFLILLFALGAQLQMVHFEAKALGRQKGYAPDQPIKFSHRVHALENKIDCQYCHNNAEVSKVAGIPSVSTCMNCHILIREGAHSGRYEINKIIEAYNSGVPIRWTKVHNLPDHVFFSHAQHVGAGKVECTECHGLVEGMDIVRQVSDLSMGWCLNCHRTRQVDLEGNAFYRQYKEVYDEVKKGELTTVTVSSVGGTECMKCHY